MNRYRHEYKYFLDMRSKNTLLIRAQGVLMRDGHTNADGTYLIRSLYFDDLYNSCMQENDAGTDPRSKFRIRYYNSDLSCIRLEKKSKSRGMTLKESCYISTEECQVFMQGRIPELTAEMPAVKQKLFLEMKLRHLLPKVIVTYERIPFVYPGGNVRITFDDKLSSSVEISKFLDGNYTTRPIMPLGHCILEVKWDEIIPLHIKDSLSLDRLQWTSFSKYYMCRLYHL